MRTSDDWKGEHLIHIKPRRDMTQEEKMATSRVIVSRMRVRNNRKHGIKPPLSKKHAAFVQIAMGWRDTPVQPPHKVEE